MNTGPDLLAASLLGLLPDEAFAFAIAAPNQTLLFPDLFG